MNERNIEEMENIENVPQQNGEPDYKALLYQHRQAYELLCQRSERVLSAAVKVYGDPTAENWIDFKLAQVDLQTMLNCKPEPPEEE